MHKFPCDQSNQLIIRDEISTHVLHCGMQPAWYFSTGLSPALARHWADEHGVIRRLYPWWSDRFFVGRLHKYSFIHDVEQVGLTGKAGKVFWAFHQTTTHESQEISKKTAQHWPRKKSIPGMLM
jgi:hypothetical protein